jgi:hypothetical protein
MSLHSWRSLIHSPSLSTSLATLAMFQSAAVIAVRAIAFSEDEGMRSLIYPSCDEIVRSLLLSRDAIRDVRKGDRSWKAS